MLEQTILDLLGHATAQRDRDDLDAAVARALASFLSARALTIYRLVDDGERRRVARQIRLVRGAPVEGLEDLSHLEHLPLLDSEPAWRECVLLEDTVHDTIADGSGWRSVFPLAGERGVVGLLEVVADEGLSEREAALVAGIIRIVHNHLALLDYGERDTLTGLLNRKTFETSFGKLLARSRRSRGPGSGQPSWLGILDIDRFKSINDTHGHLFGDEVLLLIARLMRRCFRGADQMFRFGGEEFIVALDRAPAPAAAAAFERLRAAVEGFAFPQIGRVTISLGFTRILAHDNPASCIERADAALYYAKRHGRNQVRGYEDLIAAGALQTQQSRGEVELF